MKPVAQPCINNSLKIHVAASNFKYQIKRKQGHLKQYFTEFEQSPLMNTKLKGLTQHNNKKQNQRISITYRQKPLLSKKKKIEPIPLLANLKQSLHAAEGHNKLKIVKYHEGTNKNVYNLVFTKSVKGMEKQPKEARDRPTSHSSSRRENHTQNSTRALLRRNNLHETMTSSLRKSEIVDQLISQTGNKDFYNRYNTTSYDPRTTTIRSTKTSRKNSEQKLKISGLKMNSSMKSSGNFSTYKSHPQFLPIHYGEVYYID